MLQARDTVKGNYLKFKGVSLGKVLQVRSLVEHWDFGSDTGVDRRAVPRYAFRYVGGC